MAKHIRKVVVMTVETDAPDSALSAPGAWGVDGFVDVITGDGMLHDVKILSALPTTVESKPKRKAHRG